MAEHETIKSILLELGLYSLGLAIVGSEARLFDLFQNDFEGLVKLCRG